ncbi:unnamed protein product, partial [Pylaiella littoralis]
MLKCFGWMVHVSSFRETFRSIYTEGIFSWCDVGSLLVRCTASLPPPCQVCGYCKRSVLRTEAIRPAQQTCCDHSMCQGTGGESLTSPSGEKPVRRQQALPVASKHHESERGRSNADVWRVVILCSFRVIVLVFDVEKRYRCQA